MVNINRSITLRTNLRTSFLPTLDDHDIYDLCRHIKQLIQEEYVCL